MRGPVTSPFSMARLTTLQQASFPGALINSIK